MSMRVCVIVGQIKGGKDRSLCCFIMVIPLSPPPTHPPSSPCTLGDVPFPISSFLSSPLTFPLDDVHQRHIVSYPESSAKSGSDLHHTAPTEVSAVLTVRSGRLLRGHLLIIRNDSPSPLPFPQISASCIVQLRLCFSCLL